MKSYRAVLIFVSVAATLVALLLGLSALAGHHLSWLLVGIPLLVVLLGASSYFAVDFLSQRKSADKQTLSTNLKHPEH